MRRWQTAEIGEAELWAAGEFGAMADQASQRLRRSLGASEAGAVVRRLRDFPFVAAASPSAVAALARRSRLRRLLANEQLEPIARSEAAVHFLHAGVLRVCISPVVIHLCGPALLGVEASVGPRVKTRAHASANCILIETPASAFWRFIDESPACARLLLRELCASALSYRQEAARALWPLRERLAEMLLALCSLVGQQRGPATRIKCHMTQESIAVDFGVDERSVRRVLTRWRAEGLVRVHKGWLVVHDQQRLAAVLESRRTYARVQTIPTRKALVASALGCQHEGANNSPAKGVGPSGTRNARPMNGGRRIEKSSHK